MEVDCTGEADDLLRPLKCVLHGTHLLDDATPLRRDVETGGSPQPNLVKLVRDSLTGRLRAPTPSGNTQRAVRATWYAM